MKDLLEVAIVPSKTNIDQYGAYVYYNIWNNTLNRFTNIERFDDKVFNFLRQPKQQQQEMFFSFQNKQHSNMLIKILI